MEFLREVLTGVRRLDEPDDESEFVDLDAELDVNGDGEIDLDDLSGLGLDDPEFDPESDDAPTDPDLSDAEFDGADLSSAPTGVAGGDPNGEVNPETTDLDGVVQQATENPDRSGLIRTVKNAHLVYKRETEEGTFEELWVYNITNMRDEQATKRAILAGTDIPLNKTTSPDGSQSYEIWASGNAEMLHITGLPS